MTTPEHTLVGVHTAIAVGLHSRYGWSVVALAGLLSNLPDWDGLPMLVNMARFESGHRVWGHNFLWICLSSALAGWSQLHFHWIERIAQRVCRYLPKEIEAAPKAKDVPFIVLFLVCAVSQTLHLPCDMVVSGGNGLSHWHLKPFWPFRDTGYIFPMIPWGDPGPTVILMFGAIVMAKFPRKLALQSAGTLILLVLYLVVRAIQPNPYL